MITHHFKGGSIGDAIQGGLGQFHGLRVFPCRQGGLGHAAPGELAVLIHRLDIFPIRESLLPFPLIGEAVRRFNPAAVFTQGEDSNFFCQGVGNQQIAVQAGNGVGRDESAHLVSVPKAASKHADKLALRIVHENPSLCAVHQVHIPFVIGGKRRQLFHNPSAVAAGQILVGAGLVGKV